MPDDETPEPPPGPQQWQWSYDGHTWTEGDLRLREAEELEQLLGLDSWYDIEPKRKAKHALAVLTVFLRRDRSAEEVEKILDNLTKRDLDEIVTLTPADDMPDFEGVIPLPAGGSGQATSGSAGLPTGSVGPPT